MNAYNLAYAIEMVCDELDPYEVLNDMEIGETRADALSRHINATGDLLADQSRIYEQALLAEELRKRADDGGSDALKWLAYAVFPPYQAQSIIRNHEMRERYDFQGWV